MTITTSAAQPPVETQEASSPLAAYARNYIGRVRAGDFGLRTTRPWPADAVRAPQGALSADPQSPLTQS